jgi:hypothetical protein
LSSASDLGIVQQRAEPAVGSMDRLLRPHQEIASHDDQRQEQISAIDDVR